MTEERPGVSQSSPPSYQGTSQTWKPVLVIGAVLLVLALVFNESPSQAKGDVEVQNGKDSFSDLAIMGGVKRTSVSQDFRGGEATAVMGGIEIDLRDAVMDRKEAVLDVSTVMGGVKVRVPQSWTVVSHVNSVMGGFKDTTRRPAEEDHRLVLKGTVLMGGLTVSN